MRHIFSVLLLVGTFGTVRAAAPAATTSAPAPAAPAAPAPEAKAPPTTEAPVLQIAGSDLLQVAIGEPLAHYIKENNIRAKVDMFGSEPALNAIENNKADLAIVAVPTGRSIAPPGYTTIPLCFQVDYVLVNNTNPLTGLDVRQVAGIFGTGREDLTRWEQVQLAGEWATHPIVPYTTSTDDGVVVELFKNTVLGHLPFKPTVEALKTPEELVKTIGDNPNAIAVNGYDPGPPAKVLLLAPERPTGAGTSRDAVRPTEQTVNSGSYPLRLPFYIVFKPADKARLRELLLLILSDEYATHLRVQHFMPVPATERSRSRLELDNGN